MKWALWILGICLIMPISIAVVLFNHGKRGIDGPLAKVDIADYPKPYRIAVTVCDTSGAPVAGIEVATESQSGTSNPEGITDSTGFAEIEEGESEVLALRVNGVEVWTSPYRGSILESILSPSCAGGIAFHVTLREAKQTGTGQPAARPVVGPEGGDKPQPEAEGRSR